MELTKNELNQKLFNASTHIIEASRYLSDVDKNFALKLLSISDRILSIIEPEKEYITEEKMNEIINEIFEIKD